MFIKHWIVIVFLIAGIYACNKETVTQFIGFQKPSNFPSPEYHFSTNEVTEAGFALGKKLFYDQSLSANNTISCASCHIQTAAFVHPGHSVSHGIYDKLGTRNAPPIMNLAWSKSFMWDGGIFDLDLQPIAPISNHVEMGNSMSNVLTTVKKSTTYPAMFQKAFGTTEITSAQLLKAISQFMVMCISSHSKYDSVMRKEGASFTPTEQAGYVLFQQKCANCHQEPLFTDQSFRSNGLSVNAINDEGHFAISLDSSNRYQFKVPSLRNSSYTAPYMHDGRFFSISEVLDFYNSGVSNTLNLDTTLKKNGRLGIAISPDEKQKLMSFLKTLDDRSFLLDKKLAND